MSHPAGGAGTECFTFPLVTLTPGMHSLYFCTFCAFRPHFHQMKPSSSTSILSREMDKQKHGSSRKVLKYTFRILSIALSWDQNVFISFVHFFSYRPHIPVSKLVVSESYDTYISRSFQVTKEIISECKSKGR